MTVIFLSLRQAVGEERIYVSKLNEEIMICYFWFQLANEDLSETQGELYADLIVLWGLGNSDKGETWQSRINNDIN